MASSLEDAREKIRWAEKHLAGMEDFVTTWHESNPYEIAEESNPGGWLDFRLVRADLPPPDYALFVGDVANNLRSALEYLVFGLDGHDGGNLVGFPIVSDKGNWPSERGKQLKGIDSNWVRVIHNFQPFNGKENKPLGLLASVNNADKHRRLHTTLIGTTKMDARAHVIGSPPMDFEIESRPYAPPLEGEIFLGVRVVLENGTAWPQFGVEGEIGLIPAFTLEKASDAGKYGGLTLYDCVARVKDIVSAFESGP